MAPERKGASTALIVTKGTRDVYKIGRGNRPEAYDLFFKRPVPLVPRHLTFEVEERLFASGEVAVPSFCDRCYWRGYEPVDPAAGSTARALEGLKGAPIAKCPFLLSDLYQFAFKSRPRRQRGADAGVRWSTSRRATQRQRRYTHEGELVLVISDSEALPSALHLSAQDGEYSVFLSSRR